MAASGERSTDREALVESAAGAVHEQDRRSGADGRIFDWSAWRRDDLARAGEAGARGSDVAPVQPVAHRGARGSKREHAETELVLRAVHRAHRTPCARRTAFVELLTRAPLAREMRSLARHRSAFRAAIRALHHGKWRNCAANSRWHG